MRADSRRPNGRGSGQAIRMRDVARRADVSPMTVSRVLRDPEKVSEETRNRVLETIREIGYVPNKLAGSLASSKSDVIGLVVPSIRNSLFADTIQGTADVLRGAGFQLMIADSGQSLADEEALVSAFVAQRVSGIILHNTRHTDGTRELVRRAGIPVVETGDLAPEPLDMTVSYSNYAAARDMTLSLARRGYRRIGFVSLHTKENDRARERRRGYVAAMKSLGRAQDPALMVQVASGLAAGAQALVHLVQSAPGLDVIFFAGDVLAIGALLECQRRSWSVPSRIAIASFDDLDLLQHTVPTVTSLRLPRREIGRYSAEVLLDRIRGSSTRSVSLDLGFEIIERDST